MLSQFKKKVISVEYKKKNIKYEVYLWPLWDWALDLLDNPLLASHFVWNAQQLYKHNGTEFEHFFQEPWTEDCWWNLQVIFLFFL